MEASHILMPTSASSHHNWGLETEPWNEWDMQNPNR